MARSEPDRGSQADALDALLTLWERGETLSPARRGLLLLGAALPDTEPATLAALPVGRRDGALLDLGDRLFGSRIACAAACEACGTEVEIDFASDGIRAGAADPEHRMVVEADGAAIEVRLPTSADLIAIETERDLAHAERRLLDRCLVAPARAPLSDAAIAAIGTAMSEADPQAEILLDMACPGCAARSAVPFDVVAHLWARLDHWAGAMLGAIDVIASRYGWSEAAVLALSPQRRQSYLDRIAGVGR